MNELTTIQFKMEEHYSQALMSLRNHMQRQTANYRLMRKLTELGKMPNHTIPLNNKYIMFWGFPGGASGKELACQCRRRKRYQFNTWVRKMPWKNAWQLTLAFLPGEFYVQRSLLGYSPWGHKQSDMTGVTQHARTLCFTILFQDG